MEDFEKIHRDFDVFSRALIASKDVDPVYPLVPKLIKHVGADKHWFVFCYAAFYSLESAIIMTEEMRTRGHWDKDTFKVLRRRDLTKFGHERRGTARNVDVQVQMFDAIVQFIDLFQKEALSKDNAHFRKRIEELPNHGGWASFKIAELYEKALGYKQLAIPDLGLDGRDPNSNDGPVGGLRWLFGRDVEYNKDWFEIWNEFGSTMANEWGVDIGEVETCLCKFHKFKTGKYYIGHDIHEFFDLLDILEADEYESMMSDLFEVEMFKKGKNYLEINKKMKSDYLKNSVIHYNHFADQLPRVDVTDIILSL